MPKPELEFQIPAGQWRPAGGPAPGIWEQILSADPGTGDHTRLMRFDPGADSTANGTLAHDFWEEVYIVRGDLTDLRLGETFTAGMYACRPPGMPHGPWRSREGVLMVEVRYNVRAAASGHGLPEGHTPVTLFTMRADTNVLTPSGLRVTGIGTSVGQPGTPLLVCLPGGSYTARYFDIPGFSLLDVAEANGFTAIALDRPGYGGSDPLPPGEVTFARNAEVLEEAIAALWATHGAGRPGIVLITHSIGSAIAVHLAAAGPSWPLLGIALHGIGVTHLDPVVTMTHAAPPGVPVVFDPEHRRVFMYGKDGTFPPDMVDRAEAATAPIPYEELAEVVDDWPRDVATVAADVRVPVHYALAEDDALWVSDQERVDAFAGLFRSAPRVHAGLARGVGHNIDHHHLGRALHLKQLAFALTCGQARA